MATRIGKAIYRSAPLFYFQMYPLAVGNLTYQLSERAISSIGKAQRIARSIGGSIGE
jgi:hypothetical protein